MIQQVQENYIKENPGGTIYKLEDQYMAII